VVQCSASAWRARVSRSFSASTAVVGPSAISVSGWGGRRTADCGDGLEEAGPDLGPPDEQEWADCVEGGLAIRAGNERVGDVEGEGGDAGEDE
jgi:hypothetical protein